MSSGPETLTPAQARLVRYVLQRGTVTRAQVAEVSGMTDAGAAILVRRLIASRALTQAGHGPSVGGRPPGLVAMHPGFAVCIAHLSAQGCLNSAVINAAGEMLATTETPDGERAEAENERFLAHAVAGVRSAGSIRGGGVIERESVSGAEALLRSHGGDPDEMLVCVDLDGAPSGCIASGGERCLPFQPLALKPSAALTSEAGLLALAEAFAAEEGSPTGARLQSSGPAAAALTSAEAEGDVAAQRTIDAVCDDLAAFLANVARLLMPERLLFAPAAHVRGLVRMEDVRRKVRRLLPADLAARVALGAIDASVGTRLTGIGLEGIDRWLRTVEAG